MFGFQSWAVVDLSEIGVGARPLGMGKASVCGIDDASSIFTNPAGLAINPHFNVISMSGNMLSDVNYFMMGASEYSPLGKFGIGYLSASTGGIPITTIEGTGPTEQIVQTGTTDYISSIIFLTYGTKLSRLLKGEKGENIYLGGSLKIFNQGFSGGGLPMKNANGGGMDMDVGLILKANRWACLGLAVNNVLPVSFGGKFTWDERVPGEGDRVESIPAVFRLGGEFKILGRSAVFSRIRRDLDLRLEYEVGREDERPAVWRAGLEFWPSNILAFRAGIDQKPKASEAGVGVDNNFTAGVGLKYMGFTFDYAYHQFGELEENTAHFFSIGYRGRDEDEGKMLSRKKEEEIKKSSVPLPIVVPKPVLKTFNDIPEGYWAKKPIEYLATLGIMGGYPDQTFRPGGTLTRAELAALLVKAKEFKVEGVKKSFFSDVRPMDWSAPYIDIAVRRKYVKGYPDGTFQPNQSITRAEAAAVFANFSGIYVKSKVKERVFPDVSKDHWASPAIAAGKQEGFFEYMSGGNFSPNASLTRAEAAEILSKIPFIKEKIMKLISGEK